VIVENGREVVIRVRGLAKSFGSHQIWDGLNLDVYRGEILGIVGGSGQGKSVLMRVITGLVKPDAGDVGLFGQNTKTLSPQDRLDIERRWGILFQDGALFSSLTVLQNIQVPMREHLELPQAMMDDLAFLKLAMVGFPPTPRINSIGTVRWHAQARLARPRTRARSRDRVPRRAHGRPRPDRRR
jgi:phospholipid/cholesterol/gamma-HCH transport system ATP-binding protein